MNNQNNNETNKINRLLANSLLLSPLLIPILVSSVIIIGFFIVGITFSFVLRVFKLSEEKLKELGFLGFTISIVSTFLTMYVGYFWLVKLNFTAVQLTPHAVLIFAILSTILLETLFKLIDKFDTTYANETLE
ncbi:epimerase [Bacillus sp. BF2-3]|uniref:epimerase n=1 Tax=Bacillus sp. BF2-3 TaxID=2217827 RepID=UPI0011EC893E|nr:epimerase [Bacillus sp. BF2-3]KAA0758873.1 epimerase [Bacillus sp. BF2-3]